MPDILPEGVEGGSLEHVLFITLTVSLDYMRDAPTLWESARKHLMIPILIIYFILIRLKIYLTMN